MEAEACVQWRSVSPFLHGHGSRGCFLLNALILALWGWFFRLPTRPTYCTLCHNSHRANQGSFLYVSKESTKFYDWFGFYPDYTTTALVSTSSPYLSLGLTLPVPPPSPESHSGGKVTERSVASIEGRNSAEKSEVVSLQHPLEKYQSQRRSLALETRRRTMSTGNASMWTSPTRYRYHGAYVHQCTC